MSDIITLDILTKADLPAEKILQGAIDAGLDDAIVIGTHEGGELYIAATTSDLARVVWLLELAKADMVARGR